MKRKVLKTLAIISGCVFGASLCMTAPTVVSVIALVASGSFLGLLAYANGLMK